MALGSLYKTFRLIFCVVLLVPGAAQAETLEQALTEAYKTNPGLAAERAKLRAADEEVSQASGGWRPTIDAVAETGRSRQSAVAAGAETDVSLSPYRTGIDVTQPVFRGFRTVSGVRAAEARVKAQRAALEDAEQRLLLDTAQAYLGVWQGQAVLGVARDREASLDKLLAATRDRLGIGELKRTDVAQAETRQKAATAARLQAERDLANQRETFARLVGRAPGDLAPPMVAPGLPETREKAVALALKNNPAVLAADYAAQGAGEDMRASKGGLLPEVSLVGSVSRGGEQSATAPDRQSSGTILARVSVPLYHAGTDWSRARQAEQTALQKKLEVDDARDKAREGVVNAWQSLETARDATSVWRDVVTASGEALEGVRTESKYGTRTILDVLNAEQELFDARVSQIRAESDEIRALLELKAALGELTIGGMGYKTDIYDPSTHYDAVRDRWVGFSPSPSPAERERAPSHPASPNPVQNDRE